MTSRRTPPNKRRILGIDPGYGRVGYGVIQAEGGDLDIIDFGCITTQATRAHADRLADIAKEVRRLIARHRPQLVAIEKLYFTNNAKTALGVSEARGAILCVAAEAKCRIVEYTPLEVKVAITGYGRAEKQQIQHLVQRLLRLSAPVKSDDAADALGVAICAAQIRN